MALLGPPNGTIEGERQANVVFEWTEPGPLAADEYYVLIITHKLGDDISWVKTPRYAVQEHGKNWLAGTTVGPDLKWKVLVARWLNPATTPVDENPYADPQAQIISPDSETWGLTWTAPEDPTAVPRHN